MARERKDNPPPEEAERPDSEAPAAAAPVELPAVMPAPVRTKDRDPAHRLAWKRERAKALGHDRH